MFFWLVAIPFFLIIAMFTIFRLPSNDLKEGEEVQDYAMAFRMAMQHDAAAKLMQEYQSNTESDMFDLGSYDLGGDTWKQTILESGYLPSSFIPDTDNITTYVRCLNGLREVASCRYAAGIYMVTAATPPSSDADTARWFEDKGAEDLAFQLNKYSGSFPVKPSGVAIPKKPRKQEGESDADFAARLEEYEEIKAQYQLLKRNYYAFGVSMPRPVTAVGRVRAYPFDDETAESRVILKRIKAVEGVVNFESEYIPTDLPSGGAGSEPVDFNGEAVIYTKTAICGDAACENLALIQQCNNGVAAACATAYGLGINRVCQAVDNVYAQYRTNPPSPKVYSLTYGTDFNLNPESGAAYAGYLPVKCEGTDFGPFTNPSYTAPVGVIGGSSFSVTTPGWYQVVLKGGASDNAWIYQSSGGILMTNKYFNTNDILTFKGIAGASYSGVDSGVAMWLGYDILTIPPVLAAGGGNSRGMSGGGFTGGLNTASNSGNSWYANGFSWQGLNVPGYVNQNMCNSVNCAYVAQGGLNNGTLWGVGGSGYCDVSFTCKDIPGGNAPHTNPSYNATEYGNWANSSTGGGHYAHIHYCGASESDCPLTCDSNDDCPSNSCDFKEGRCN